MKTILDKPEDIQWLKDTFLKGVILPKEYQGFKCVILIGNEDAPEQLHIYKSKAPTIYDKYLDMKFEYDTIYCTYKEMTPTANGQKAGIAEFQVMKRYAETAVINGQTYGRKPEELLWFHTDTIAEVRGLLIDLHASRQRCRVFYGDPVTGRALPQASRVSGSVRHMAGHQIMAPYLTIGPGQTCPDGTFAAVAMPTQSIVGVQDMQGKWLYRHATLHFGDWSVIKQSVLCDNMLQAKFRTATSANQFVKYMTGEATTKPRRSAFL